MEKVQLIVLGLSASPASNNAYALILKELNGNRRLPIIIGAFEAQAIALEMEGVIPPRPMTHDLIKNMLDSFNVLLTEVYINELRDGTFYAKLIFDDAETELDARPSDAIALAVRCSAPIYVNSDILDETGLMPQQGEGNFEETEELGFMKNENKTIDDVDKSKPKTRRDMLISLLDKAINDENYERAAELRDELNKLSEN